jgi:hypothetical protein
LRWLYNYRGRESDGEIIFSEWETPTFAKIKGKKTKCQSPSPYLETEIWDRDEILFIVKYEPWMPICTFFQLALYPSCNLLVNSDGTLTDEGDRAFVCIRNGAALEIEILCIAAAEINENT